MSPTWINGYYGRARRGKLCFNYGITGLISCSLMSGAKAPYLQKHPTEDNKTLPGDEITEHTIMRQIILWMYGNKTYHRIV
ncbi:MAG: hypothetical protein C0392_15550 [Syntrophus sp. (in: bacteria)]|nr:hypothetical protein [Syntrophus sp. (in: bacteria)]